MRDPRWERMGEIMRELEEESSPGWEIDEELPLGWNDGVMIQGQPEKLRAIQDFSI